MGNWVIKNEYLSMSEMQNNALLVHSFFSGKGWTLEAISAMLGNMQTESFINPGLWESFKEGNTSVGYGLVQWTPARRYISWAGDNWNSGDKQCQRLAWEVDNPSEYFEGGLIVHWGINYSAPYPEPPITFKEFTKSTLPPETLANYFLWYYEKPAVANQPVRAEQARYWYDFLKDKPVTPPPVVIPKRTNKSIFFNTKWALLASFIKSRRM